MERDDRPLLVALLIAILINSIAAFITDAVSVRNFLLGSAAVCAAYYAVVVWLLPRLTPRRFANLVFVLDDEGNMVVINHPAYNKLNPPGSRLSIFEAPHEAVGRVMRDELGLEEQPGRWRFDDRIHPSVETVQVRIVPRPFQVQIEPGKHRRRVREHLDFVYVCRLQGTRPPVGSTKYSPMWISYQDFCTLPAERRFADVSETYARVLAELGLRNQLVSKATKPTGSVTLGRPLIRERLRAWLVDQIVAVAQRAPSEKTETPSSAGQSSSAEEGASSSRHEEDSK